MPTPTYTPLATTTLVSTSTSITFSSIPATYRDLRLIISVPPSGAAPRMLLRINGDSGTNYSGVRMYGTGSSTASNTTSGNEVYVLDASNTGGAIVKADIMDYSATDKHKTLLIRMDDSAAIVFGIAARWANTAAITSLGVSASVNSYPVGTVISLYGIAS